jgi:hypothetical protein
MWITSVAITACFFLVEIKIIPKLDDDNRFKRWWRKNVVGVYNGSDF